MADINQIITLGIGTPASIPHFLLFGLSPNPGIAVVPSATRSITLNSTQSDTLTLEGLQSGAVTVDA